MRASRVSVIALMLLVLAACSGDDSDRKRTEAAEWCKQALYLDGYFDNGDGRTTPSAQINYTTAAEWVDKAPSDIRDATERFATFQKQADVKPEQPDDYADVREQIAQYAEDHCPEPLTCIADVDGNLRLPCY